MHFLYRKILDLQYQFDSASIFLREVVNRAIHSIISSLGYLNHSICDNQIDAFILGTNLRVNLIFFDEISTMAMLIFGAMGRGRTKVVPTRSENIKAH